MAASDDEMEEQLLGGKRSFGRMKAWFGLASAGSKETKKLHGKYTKYEMQLRGKGEKVFDSAADALGYLSYVAYAIPPLKAVVSPISTPLGVVKTAKDFRKLAKTIQDKSSQPLLLPMHLRTLIEKLEEFQRETYGEREGNSDINDFIESIELYVAKLESGD